MKYKYVIPGNPIPLARARMGKTRMWDSQKQAKLNCALILINQHNDRPLYEGPIALNISFFIGIPFAQKKKNMHGKPHVFKPDLDNLLKFYCDVMSKGVLLKDDCNIAYITCKKVYDDKPRTEFIICRINEIKNDKSYNLSK